MRHALIGAACALACGCDDRTTVDPTIVQDHVIVKVWPVPEVTRVDSLYIVDRSPALAPFRETFERQLGFAGMALLTQPGYVDLHVGVVTADLGDNRDSAAAMPGQCAGWGDGGALLHSTLVDGSFITVRQTPAAQVTNVAGSLAAALPALADLDAIGCDRAQPLEAMRIALDNNPHNAGFLRDDTKLFITIVSAQRDDSPRSQDAYAAFLRGLKSSEDVYVYVASDDPQLRAFSRLFPNRGEASTLAGADLDDFAADPYDWLHPFGPVIASPCFDEPLLDTDPATAGLQPDCVVTEGSALVPACTDAATFPCWRIYEDPRNCSVDPTAITIDRADIDPPEGALDRAECMPR